MIVDNSNNIIPPDLNNINNNDLIDILISNEIANNIIIVNNNSNNSPRDKINNFLVYVNSFVVIIVQLVFFIIDIIILLQNQNSDKVCDVVFNYIYLCCCASIISVAAKISISIFYYKDKRQNILRDITIRQMLVGNAIFNIVVSIFGIYVFNSSINECSDMNNTKLVDLYYTNIFFFTANFVVELLVAGLLHIRV